MAEAMTEIIIVALIGVGLGEFVAWLGIIFRYAIPRAPVLFHVLLTPPMIVGCLTAFGLAYIGLSAHDATVVRFDALVLLALHFSSLFLFFLTMNAYAAYWYLKGRRCPA
jgi:hypothetical protein